MNDKGVKGCSRSCRMGGLLYIGAWIQSELEINRKRKEKLATPHENPKQRKCINRVPCVRKAFCTGPRVLATSSLFLLRSEDTVFTRCFYGFLLLLVSISCLFRAQAVLTQLQPHLCAPRCPYGSPCAAIVCSHVHLWVGNFTSQDFDIFLRSFRADSSSPPISTIHMYVYIYIYTYTYYIYIYIYICIYYKGVYIYIYIYIYMCRFEHLHGEMTVSATPLNSPRNLLYIYICIYIYI